MSLNLNFYKNRWRFKDFFIQTFEPLFHPFSVKNFQNPSVDVHIMKINICPNFTFLQSTVTAVHASYLSQWEQVLLYIIYRLISVGNKIKL